MLYSYVKTDNSEDVHQMFTIVLLEGKKEEKRKKKKREREMLEGLCCVYLELEKNLYCRFPNLDKPEI